MVLRAGSPDEEDSHPPMPVRPLRMLSSLLTVALSAAGCNDGIRLNDDLAIRKRLAGTPLALVRREELPTALVWERGSAGPDIPVFAPPRDALLPGTVAWDGDFVVGTHHDYERGHDGKESSRVAWFVIDVAGPAGPRVVYDGEDRANYEAARSKLGVGAELVPRPLLHYWPNWAGSPDPSGRSDAAAQLDPQTGTGTTVRPLPVGEGYFVQDALRTFLWLSKQSPEAPSAPVALTRRTSDVFRIGWDERFIVADICFLVSDGGSEPTVDLTMPVGTVVVDTKTAKSSLVVNHRSVGKLRREFGVPDALQPRDVVLVWPDWPEIRRPWRRDPSSRKHLGLD